MSKKQPLWNILTIGWLTLALAIGGCQRNEWIMQPDEPVADAALRTRAIKVLEQAFADPHEPRLRANAVEGLAGGLGVKALAYLEKAMEDPAAIVRGVALMSAGNLRLPAGKAMGRRLLKDRNQAVRVSAAYAMAKAGDRSAMNVIPAALAHKDPNIQAQGAMVLGRLADMLDGEGRSSSIEMLRPLTRAGIPAATRVQALGAQAAMGNETAIRHLRKMLFVRGGDVRMEALAQLSLAQSNRLAQEALLIMLDDDFPGARATAASALARHTPSRRSFPVPLSRAYREAWFFSQGLGADYRSDLYFVGSEKIAPLPPEDILRIRLPAIRAVGAVGEPPTSGLLMRLMTDANPRIRTTAAAAALEYLKLSVRIRKAAPAREM